MDDVRAVMDAAGSERAALMGISEGVSMCILFAATYPDRTRALVDDTLTALANGAHAWREGFAIPLVGVAGSNGKTIVKEIYVPGKIVNLVVK